MASKKKAAKKATPVRPTTPKIKEVKRDHAPEQPVPDEKRPW